MQLKNKIQKLSNSSKYFSLLHTETMIAHFFLNKGTVKRIFWAGLHWICFPKGFADFVGGKND